MGDSWLAMEACLRLEPRIIHRVVLTTGYRFFDYLTPKNYNRYNRLIIAIIFRIQPLFALKTSHFPYKIQKFRTFSLIYLHISKIFRTFAAGFLMRTHMHTHRIYVHAKPTMPTTTQPRAQTAPQPTTHNHKRKTI